ncbi:hypothetical protein CHARACLAT_016469 [Characodon lateralis]|uniref:Uncharacterized protein n=1 Tax=Characodon lateralis TaxID=208331 RepID=A0ABU7EJR8_9TELE|nr:hypothetical protein [Characodon lateralis]
MGFRTEYDSSSLCGCTRHIDYHPSVSSDRKYMFICRILKNGTKLCLYLKHRMHLEISLQCSGFTQVEVSHMVSRRMLQVVGHVPLLPRPRLYDLTAHGLSRSACMA